MTLTGLFDSLHNMVLVNNRVECYVNSAFWTVSWIHLLCNDMTALDWANLRAPFAEIILQGSGHPIDLKCHSLMQSGLTKWKLLRKGDQQEDHSDFLAFLLGWMGTNKVTHAYEKRLEIADGVQSVEKGGPNSPILLQQEMWEHLPCPTALPDVLHNWMAQTGMTCALQIASTLVCLQVCRFETMEVADRREFILNDRSVMLPVFIDANSNRTAMVKYMISGAVMYSGNSMQGHYRGAIHVKQTWLVQDDNQPPQSYMTLPTWFNQGLSHIWLLRADRLREWNDASAHADTSASETLLAMAEVRAFFK